ncbi:hypothetical protein [Luteolibacter flavescens]|uniref:hypothetical protein n=1 Tax=Luteolibacter flavescens TaxID=1859460 RepID=UPI002223258B|nr:hypothetical protein [Luteolibacter flavescens]
METTIRKKGRDPQQNPMKQGIPGALGKIPAEIPGGKGPPLFKHSCHATFHHEAKGMASPLMSRSLSEQCDGMSSVHRNARSIHTSHSRSQPTISPKHIITEIFPDDGEM